MRVVPLWRHWALLALPLGLNACGSDPAAPPDGPADPQVATELLWQGGSAGVVDNQDGFGEVRAVDAAGRAVAGVEVRWQVAAGPARFAPGDASVVTGTDGTARGRFTAASSGEPIRLRAEAGPSLAVESADLRAWDLQYHCDWECYLAPGTLRRPLGAPIRALFSHGAWGPTGTCTFDEDVPGLVDRVMRPQFVIQATGTHAYTCTDGQSSTTGAIEIMP